MYDLPVGDRPSLQGNPDSSSPSRTAQPTRKKNSQPIQEPSPTPTTVREIPKRPEVVFREYRETGQGDAPPLPRLSVPTGKPAPSPKRPALGFLDAPINPQTPRRFNVISLFAGCGGSSLGYKWAGGKILAAIEWDKDAAATYRRNHEKTPVLERDIATVMGAELLALTGLAVGELDVLDGSPPCQGFSLAGRRNLDDPRNSLFREYARLLTEIRPRCLVMENVAGMVKGAHREIFADALRALKSAGYTVRAWLLDAMYFGVPQSRQRVIFLGVRPARHYTALRDIGIYRNEGRRYPTSVLTFDRDRPSHHPTAKPVNLCRWLVKTYSHPGQTVLDPFAGGGSTAVAALREGRNVIACELDAAYYEVMRARVAALDVDLETP